MGEHFVSEPLTPDPTAIGATGMAAGVPGLPRRFAWGGRVHEIARVLESWRESGPERGRRGPHAQTYLRRHWWRIITTGGLRLRIYCERQLRRGGGGRWWVYSVEGEEKSGKAGNQESGKAEEEKCGKARRLECGTAEMGTQRRAKVTSIRSG